MKNQRYAFTLVETLIMMAIIGVIGTVTVVSLRGMRPDKDKMMIKKAYSEIVKAVDSLINDSSLYPYARTAFLLDGLRPIVLVQSAITEDMTTFNCTPSEMRSCENNGGLYDDFQCKCVTKGSNDVTVPASPTEGNFVDKKTDRESWGANAGSGVFTDISVRCPEGVTCQYTAENKFAYNFMRSFETTESGCEGSVCEFTALDGTRWVIDDNFSTEAANAVITVDINGASVGADVMIRDIFLFDVAADGAVRVHCANAVEYPKNCTDAEKNVMEILTSRNIRQN